MHSLRYQFNTYTISRSRSTFSRIASTSQERLVQKALGHASLTTTMIYTHIVDDDMETAMRALDI